MLKICWKWQKFLAGEDSERLVVVELKVAKWSWWKWLEADVWVSKIVANFSVAGLRLQICEICIFESTTVKLISSIQHKFNPKIKYFMSEIKKFGFSCQPPIEFKAVFQIWNFPKNQQKNLKSRENSVSCLLILMSVYEIHWVNFRENSTSKTNKIMSIYGHFEIFRTLTHASQGFAWRLLVVIFLFAGKLHSLFFVKNETNETSGDQLVKFSVISQKFWENSSKI